jgi:hypothetical protein
VRSVANHLGGSMAVEAGPQERGCAISVLLPLASSAR